MSFKSDLAREQKNMPDIITKLLRIFVAGTEIKRYPGGLRDADLYADMPSGARAIIEVKENFKCKTTGNVAIEYTSRNKPSGITTTRADYWFIVAHLDPEPKYILISVKKLLQLIADKHYIREVGGGDYGSNTRMYLFPVEALCESKLETI